MDNGGSNTNNNSLSETSLAFIGASVTLVLAIVIIILLIISFRLCLKVVQRRYMVQSQLQHANEVRSNHDGQAGGDEEHGMPSFNWRHSLRIAGTLPPSYEEAKELPPADIAIELMKQSEQELSKFEKTANKQQQYISDGDEDLGGINGGPGDAVVNTVSENGGEDPAIAAGTDTVIDIDQEHNNNGLMETLHPTAS